MKNWSFFAFLLLGIMSCQTDNTTGDGASGTAAAAEATHPTGGGSFRAPVPVGINSREAQALVQQYWVFEYYIDPNVPTNNRLNRGRWYKFNPDGTFESGHWDQKTANGSWGLGMSQKHEYVVVHLDSNIDAEDSEYMIQGINDENDAMSWVGTDLYDQGHIMLKTMQLLTMPTKKQFGLE